MLQVNTKTRYIIIIVATILFIIGSWHILTSKADDKTIGFITTDYHNPFFYEMLTGSVKQVMAKGYKIEIRESNNNPDQEFYLVRKMVSDGFKILLLNPIDNKLSNTAIDYAAKHNVKVIALDSQSNNSNVLANVLSDNALGGKLAAEYMIEKMGNKGNVVIIRGITTTSTSEDRYNGFMDTIKTSDINVIDTVRANFSETQSYYATIDLLSQHENINGIFVENDEMAIGAVMAIQEKYRKKRRSPIVIVGFDGTSRGISAVKNNVMSATIKQEPYKIGQLGVDLAIDYLTGKEVEPKILVPVYLITQKEAEKIKIDNRYIYTDHVFNIPK